MAIVRASLPSSRRHAQPPFRAHTLPSGPAGKSTAVHLLGGMEHDERRRHDDTFGLADVSAAVHGALAALDREMTEVFEFIRPISAQWGLTGATMAAFPTTKRQGR